MPKPPIKLFAEEIRAMRARSLSSAISRHLESLILSGKIKPGDRINESRLAAALEVSRAPIREACRRLEKHGMVEVFANRGTFVRSIQPKEVVELYDIRAALEALAGERAAERVTPRARKELRGHFAAMRRCEKAGSVTDYYAANAKFHSTIIRASGNASLSSLYDSICKQVQLFRRTSLSLPGRLRVSLNQHQEILAAVLTGNGDQAGRLLRNHVLDAGRTLVSALSGTKRPSKKKSPHRTRRES
jgi:DNA-binding GntR family transcriptional regulator